MFYYRYQNKLLFSQLEQNSLEPASMQDIAESNEIIYCLLELDPLKSRRSFCLSSAALIELEKEDLQLLQQQEINAEYPQWLLNKASAGQIKAININYPNWQAALEAAAPAPWRVNLVGLGDVGSTMLIGLKLLGEDIIRDIGIYDLDSSKVVRWEFECNQILSSNQVQGPRVFALEEQQLFDCDMFVFCVTAGIPSLESKGIDVRMAQFEGNSRIISLYAKKAREAGFKGVFAVVSDPVDLLCKKALQASNVNEAGDYDYKGLAPEQIRGYGLGVMNARAAYYASQAERTIHYLKEGRAFGPHGQHLVIADSIQNYNDELSVELTRLAATANIELRKHGYKPYVAPALSSAAIPILATISGDWHYSATYMGGVYMGARNRVLPSGTMLEQNRIPEPLMQRLLNSYKELEQII